MSELHAQTKRDVLASIDKCMNDLRAAECIPETIAAAHIVLNKAAENCTKSLRDLRTSVQKVVAQMKTPACSQDGCLGVPLSNGPVDLSVA